MSDPFSKPTELSGLDELRSAVRSLYRWTWWTAALLWAYAALWLTFLAIQVISVGSFVAWGDESAVQMVSGFMLSVLIGGALVLFVVGLPAMFVTFGARHAGKALATADLSYVVSCIVCLRKFLVTCTVFIILYLIISMIVALA